MRPKQLPFVEDPARVLLIPLHLGQGCTWWSHDGSLLGGVKVNGGVDERGIPAAHNPVTSKVMCLPTLIPESWGENKFGVVLEYEAESPQAKFRFRVLYGCGDPSELRVGKTRLIETIAGKKDRVVFLLNPEFIHRNEMMRVTIEVVRESHHAVLLYGAWLDVHLDSHPVT